MKEMFEALIYVFIVYFLYANLIFFSLLILSFFQIRKIIRSYPMIESLKRHSFRLAPPVSIIAPAYNEKATIVHSVQSFLSLDYPDFEVILVNDGSKDESLEVLKKSFRLVASHFFYDDRLSKTKVRGVYQSEIHPNLIVVDKVNSGKADSINVGIGFSRYDLFCAVDSDSILDSDSLVRVALPFIEDPEFTVASGGTIRPVNGSEVKYGRVVKTVLPRNLLARIQVVEYLRAFLFGRVGWNMLNATMIISGAFGLFKKEAVISAGGYRHDSVGEDMELVGSLRRYGVLHDEPTKIAFVPDPICWTEVPSNLSGLARQRDRWQRGLAGTLYRFQDLLFNHRYGWVGWVAYPYFLVVELLGPFVEVCAYVLAIVGLIFGWLRPELVILFFVVDILYGVMMSFSSVLIEESAYHKYPRLVDLMRLMLSAVFEHFGYRQFTTLCRLVGLIKFFMGHRNWGEMKRTGFEGSR